MASHSPQITNVDDADMRRWIEVLCPCVGYSGDQGYSSRNTGENSGHVLNRIRLNTSEIYRTAVMGLTVLRTGRRLSQWAHIAYERYHFTREREAANRRRRSPNAAPLCPQ